MEQTQRAEQLRLADAQDTLMPKIIGAAEQMSTAFVDAMDRFWKGKYTPAHMAELDNLEYRGAERFLTWFAFDYVQEDGRTLVETLAQAASAGQVETDEYETRLLQDWHITRLRPYSVELVFRGKGVRVRDILNDVAYEVKDYGASKMLAVGEVIIGHLVRVGTKDAGEPPKQEAGAGADVALSPPPAVPLYYVGGAVAQLTAGTRQKLLEFARLYLEDLRHQQSNATWDDLIRQHSHIFNHFVMALPVEEYDPNLLDDMILQARGDLQIARQSFSSLSGHSRSGDSDDDNDSDSNSSNSDSNNSNTDSNSGSDSGSNTETESSAGSDHPATDDTW